MYNSSINSRLNMLMTKAEYPEVVYYYHGHSTFPRPPEMKI